MAQKQDLKNNKANKTHSDKHFISKKVLIFASGNGSNFEAIVRHFNSKDFCTPNSQKPSCKRLVEIELITDKKNAPVIDKAKKLGIPYFYVKFENLYDFLKPKKDEYDLFVLAGFMRILPEKILKLGTNNVKQAKNNKFINIHPSLLPNFKGKNAILKAFKAGEEKTGVTIHFVEKKVDAGKIIAQKSILIGKKSLPELEKAIHKIEHKMYPEIIENLLFKTNVLLFGGGAREHALAEKLSVSPFLDNLYLINPNDGFKNLGKILEYHPSNNSVQDYQKLAKKACALNIHLLVVGPENPLFEGISDIFQNEDIKVIGANKKWSALEGSKIFAKNFMKKNGIKTADFKILETKSLTQKHTIQDALKYFISKHRALPVIKADGAALGKGVELPATFIEAEFTIKEFLDGKFGEASKKIILEERLFGKEISLLSLWDGKTLASFPPASDYKRLLDNNKGKNTGGMGAYAPSKVSIKEKEQIKKYLKNLKTALIKDKVDFCGIIYSGLILTKKDIYVLEYNMRFGDPETQVLLELLETDLLYTFLKTTSKSLNEIDLKFNTKTSCSVVLASFGYPNNPKKGVLIKNLETANKFNCKIFFAGVKNNTIKDLDPITPKPINLKPEISKDLITNGGRILNIVKSGTNKKKILDDIYKTASSIDFDGKIFRNDIGKIYNK